MMSRNHCGRRRLVDLDNSDSPPGYGSPAIMQNLNRLALDFHYVAKMGKNLDDVYVVRR